VETHVEVRGVREVNSALRQIDRKLASEFGADLKVAAAPVVEAAKSKEQRWQGASVNTIRARRSGARVYVGQAAKKVTGLRGDFGALQMRQALIPALDEGAVEVFAAVDVVLDKYASEAGF
jgi:hypothetical protein